MRKWLIKLLMRPELREREQAIFNGPVVAGNEAVAKDHATCRVGVVHAMNGKMLEVSTFKRSQHGPDWTTKYWILDEEQPLADQISTVLAMHGLAR